MSQHTTIEAEMVRDERGRWVIPVPEEGRDDLPRSFRRGEDILDEYGDTVGYERIPAPTFIDLAVTDWPEHITGPLPVTLLTSGHGVWVVFYEGQRFGKARGHSSLNPL